jgi:hypothetical protein
MITTVTIIWPDGTTSVGRSENPSLAYRRAFDAAREVQAHPYTYWGFRWELQRRAEVWSGERVRQGRQLRQFLRNLERAGLFRIEVEDEEVER